MSETIRVDIWSDIACPWCYLGKHRFEAGVAAFNETHPDVRVEVESHSYELAPDTPLDFSGSEIDFLVKHKGMPAERVEQMLGEMTEMAAAEGVTFDFTRVQHANTQRAHRVLHLAKDQGVQAAVQERLFRAYFAEGESMSDPEALARLGAEAGLAPDDVRAALDSEAYGEAVQRDITRAQMLGITGVPFFLLEQQYGVSGAQSAEAFTGVFEQVLELNRAAAAAAGDPDTAGDPAVAESAAQ
ncbi:DsbA family protein [Leucobacter luti]|uniref:Putative DsbA family dithiol-disulfide isomerase n=1 Tax=Leucobacter luti TaxID=340320 RepID=A0A4R6RX05_9MICO|nr:DsbA family oxidoreductase [Leucobacter luti]MCW2288331.1 putative DsbA family dithiol-disulfide isomerase [Leucobacter luti]QYM75722.1 DsbA family oxidoreductase [Leucobacter luti]TCK45512.1 putative DsbA family dithiol-disulfide isomerase [Leucobacter luti]TDP91581.1 putative DsbA family dithiol-disulfide isomerase [Leucobacter luti]